MNIVILSGSPKGEQSVTLQYACYIQKHFPDVSYEIVHVGHDIKKIQNDNSFFQSIMDKVQKADGVIWLFPVYFYLVPCQLKQFIELIYEQKQEQVFLDKYATAITTSVHFFDHTAHNYIRSVSEDLRMKYVDGLSMDMYDLLRSGQRSTILQFARSFFRFISEKMPTGQVFMPLSCNLPTYTPENVAEQSKNMDKKVLVLTDEYDHTSASNLTNMIDVLQKLLPVKAEIINISEVDIKGGCLSCYQCVYDNTCAYRDGFAALFNTKVRSADVIIFAGRIKDRFLSARWKMFLDRTFFRGHCPVFKGKQIAYLISGPLRQLPNLREVLEGIQQNEGAALAGIVTDEYDNSAYVTSLLANLARQITLGWQENRIKPGTFLAEGGRLIFRDVVYKMSWFFYADFVFYKKHKLLQYPNTKIMRPIKHFMMRLLLRIPRVRKTLYGQSVPKMLEEYQKVVKNY